MKKLLLALLFAASTGAHAAQPATMRLDYLHTGNALGEQYAIERVVLEPLPWAGDMGRTIDDTNRGINKVEVVDIKTGKVLYTRGFSTIFGEWRTTDEASKLTRGFSESVRFPQPEQPVRVRILKRDERNEFSVVWSVDVDPNAMDVVRKQPLLQVKPIPIHVSGPSPQKVDLLIMGDGYTKAELPKFEQKARKL
ncbi:MAG TPA: peptidase M64 N-terminal domain-containing protein, partial [Pseudoxanthomonas sp.]